MTSDQPNTHSRRKSPELRLKLCMRIAHLVGESEVIPPPTGWEFIAFLDEKTKGLDKSSPPRALDDWRNFKRWYETRFVHQLLDLCDLIPECFMAFEPDDRDAWESLGAQIGHYVQTYTELQQAEKIMWLPKTFELRRWQREPEQCDVIRFLGGTWQGYDHYVLSAGFPPLLETNRNPA